MASAALTKQLTVGVVGSGIAGLATALLLTRQGHRVRILYADSHRDATSSKAAAVWQYPPFGVLPEEKARKWCMDTLPHLLTFCDDSGSGCRRRVMYETIEETWHLQALQDTLQAEQVENPFDNKDMTAKFFVRYNVVVADMWLFPLHLQRLLLEDGVTFTQGRAQSLSHAYELLGKPDVMVNCCGLAATKLVNDANMVGVQGQALLVHCPAVKDVLCHDFHPDGLTYIIPRENGLVLLGGTYKPLERDETEGEVVGDHNVQGRMTGFTPKPDAAEFARIIKRCADLHPAVATAPVYDTWTGLRPSRKSGVRLEIDRDACVVPVVHNYGRLCRTEPYCN